MLVEMEHGWWRGQMLRPAVFNDPPVCPHHPSTSSVVQDVVNPRNGECCFVTNGKIIFLT